MAIYKRGCNKDGPDGTCSKCGKRRSCGVYWYKFRWYGKLVRESTKQGNDKVARQMEAAHRTSLAKGEVGIRERKTVPTLAEFMDKRFETWIKSTTAPKTWLDFYRVGVRAIKACKSISSLPLNELNSENIAEFAAQRKAQKDGLQVSTVNSSLRVLRRVLRQAVEWEVIDTIPKIKMLPGEKHRERVLSIEEEARYLATASEPLASVAAVLADTGMRPEECYRLRWETVTWANGRNGTLLVTHGKTKAARRVLPFTPRVRSVLETRWTNAKHPEEGWVWPSTTKSGHIEPCSLKRQHRRALKLSGVRPFVLYSLRHTFLTRLGESGCDAWTLARIAGHSSISISARYVHPSENAVLNAVEKLGGHNSGHRLETEERTAPIVQQLSGAITES